MKQIKKIGQMLTFTAIFLSVVGCTPMTNYKEVFDAHEKAFKSHNSFKEHYIKEGKEHLYAREFGKENQGEKPTILLMHGFPDSMHLYDELIPYLSKNRHVIAFDFLGWGDSDKPENHAYTSKSLQKDLETVIDYFKLDEVVLVAHDASGPPSIDWAMEHEKRVKSLVLLNTYYQPMQILKAPEAIELFSTPSTKRSMTIMVATNSDSAWQSGIIEQLEKFMSNPQMRDQYSKLFAYQALGIRQAFFGLNDVLHQEMGSRDKESVKRLANFKKPVKIIFGDDDPYLNRGVAKEFHALFPNSTLKLIENAGHYVQVDKPNEVAEVILKSLEH